jgi:hypothetical protein
MNSDVWYTNLLCMKALKNVAVSTAGADARSLNGQYWIMQVKGFFLIAG